VRRLTRSGLAATAAALAAGSVIALGGALPASAAPAAHPAVHVTVTASAGPAAHSSSASPDTSPGYYDLSATADGCTEDAVLEFYYSSYGYWNIKITIDTSEYCVVDGYYFAWEAAATCSGYNFWGSPAYFNGDYTIASCDSSYPTFQHGGWRIDIGGTWYYYTDRITPA
jgi:hypothetical protein